MFESLESRRLLAIAINVGMHPLQPNMAGQVVEIRATGSPDDLIAGFNTRAQLGDGLGPMDEPVFSELRYDNSIWGDLDKTPSGGPVDGALMVAQGSITLDTAGETVAADGLTVTLVIDTTGITSGTFPLKLSDTIIGADSVFIRNGGDDFPIDITNGSVIIGTPGTNLSIAVDDSQKPEGDSGSTPFTFTVTRFGDLTGATSVDYVVSGSGSNPADAQDFGGAFPSDTIEFGVGQAEKTITVDVSGDTIVEPDNPFTVTLLNATDGAVIHDAAASGLIQNDDATTISIAASDAVKPEGTSGTTPFSFVVSRAGDRSRTDTVAYSVIGIGDHPADALDFGGAFPSGVVTFAPGDQEETVTVDVSGDIALEFDESFRVSLSNVSTPATIATSFADGAIQNDDSTVLNVTIDVGTHHLLPNTAGQEIAIVAVGGPTELVTGFNTRAQIGDGTGPLDEPVFSNLEYDNTIWTTPFTKTENPVVEDAEMVAQGSINLNSGVPIAADGVVVRLIVDTTGIASGTFELKLADTIIGADSVFIGGGGQDAIAAITNGTIVVANPSLSIAADDAQRDEGNSGQTPFTFEITRSGNLTQTATVDYQVVGSGANPADAADFGGALPVDNISFGVGERSKTLTINVSGDIDPEADESFTVELSNPSGITTLGTATASSLIIDDDLLFDFGDAPAVYPVTLAQDGARHTIGSLFLGDTVDDEGDGNPSVDASGDGSDEDGVFPLVNSITSPSSSTISSLAIDASQAGKLDAWIDFNADGDWDDANEKIFSSVNVPQGVSTLSYAIPAGSTAGSTAARFRLSSAGGLDPTGEAIDGEVEDYIVELEAAGSNTVSFTSIGAGTTTVETTGQDIVVRSGGMIVFQGPANQLAVIDLVGTSSVDLFELDLSVTVYAGRTQIDGGTQTDTLQLTGATQSLDVDSLPSGSIRGIEVIDLTASGSQSLTIAEAQIAAMPDAGQTLRLLMAADDILDITSGDFAIVDSLVEGEQFFVIAQSPAATFHIGGLNWTNPLSRMDVNNSGTITPLDALVILNQLTRKDLLVPGTGRLIDPRDLGDSFPLRFYDTTSEGVLTPLDALRVLNFLSRGGTNNLTSGPLAGEPRDAREATVVQPQLDADEFSKQIEPSAASLPDSITYRSVSSNDIEDSDDDTESENTNNSLVTDLALTQLFPAL